MRDLRLISSAKLRNFFLWLRSKEFLVFLSFFLVSCLFWLMLSMKDIAEMDVVIPLKIEKKSDKGFIVDEGNDTKKVTVTVRDYRYNLLYYTQDIAPIEIPTIAFNKSGDGKIFLSNSDLTKYVKKRLQKSTKLVSIKPDRLEYYYIKKDYHKKVPVVVQGSVTPAENRFIVSTIINPDSVIVYAPKSKLDQIDSVVTRRVDIKDVTEKKTYKVRLAKDDGVVLEVNTILMEVLTDMHASGSKEVPIKPVNVPEGKVLRTIPRKVIISYVTASSLTKNISEEDFTVEVDYMDVEKNEGTLPLKLKRSPTYVRRVEMNPQEVDFTIEKE